MGINFTGPEGNSIFMPFSGVYNENGLVESGYGTGLMSGTIYSIGWIVSRALCFAVIYDGRDR